MFYDHDFQKLVWVICHYRRTDADFLRRKCRIDYRKLCYYFNELEDIGFLGPYGPRGRELLRTWDDWLELLKENHVAIDHEAIAVAAASDDDGGTKGKKAKKVIFLILLLVILGAVGAALQDFLVMQHPH